MEKIKAIYEKDFVTAKPNVQYRVGRTGNILPMSVGNKMIFAYEKPTDGYLHTSPVVEWEESDHEVLVETKNTIYVFEKLASKSDKPNIEF